MTVASIARVALATAKFLFDMCDCAVDSDNGKGDFSLVLGILHMSGHVHIRSHVFSGMYGG